MIRCIMKRGVVFLAAMMLLIGAMPVQSVQAQTQQYIEVKEALREEAVEIHTEAVTEADTEADLSQEIISQEAFRLEKKEDTALTAPLGYENGGAEEIPVVREDVGDSEAVTGTCGENLNWSYQDGVLTISGTGDMEDYGFYNDQPGWSAYKYSITSIVIESGVTSIGKYAFTQCNRLTSVIVPDTVTKIGYAAFGDCINLTDFQGGKGLVELDEYVFQNVPLKKFHVGKDMTTISEAAFFKAGIQEFTVDDRNNVYLEEEGILYTDGGKTLFFYPKDKEDTEFLISSTVTKIADMAFVANEHLESITLQEGIVSIGYSAFQECQSLQTIIIPDSVTEMGNFAFYGCPGLTAIKFGQGLEEGSYMMAEGCTKLKDIDFGGMKSLAYRAFALCTALESIVLPDTFETIGYSSFRGCSSLSQIHIGSGVTEILEAAFYECEALEQVVIPESVQEIGRLAFPETTELDIRNSALTGNNNEGYYVLESVSVTGDGSYDYAFQVLSLVNQEREKEGLGKLYMDESLLETAMLRAAEISFNFSHVRPNGKNCYSANRLMTGENIAAGSSTPEAVMEQWMNSTGHRANILGDYTSIGIGCFKVGGRYFWVQCFGDNQLEADCAQPEDATTTHEIRFVSNDYKNCFVTILDKTYITAGEDTAKATLYVNNPGWYYVYTPLDSGVGFTWVSSDTEVATVEEDGTVTGVNWGTASISAQLGYYSSEGADVWVQVTLVDETGNFKCSTMLDGTWEIVEYVGSGDSVEIPSEIDGRAVSSIRSYAFYNCTELEGDLIIPESIIYIGYAAFYNCNGFDGKISLPEKMSKIGDYAFFNCNGLKGDLIIPEGITHIGYAAFYNCRSLDGELNIPEGITAIDDYAFNRCSGLKGELKLPDSLTSIGYAAFYNCSGLEGLLVIPQSVTSIGDAAFMGCSGLTKQVYITENTTDIAETALLLGTPVTAEAYKEVTIHAPKGSYAEEYANTYGYSYAEWNGEEIPQSNPFADVSEGSWQYTYAKFALDKGLMSGKGTDVSGKIVFDPDQNMTRAEFVQVLYNKEGKPAVTYVDTFNDVPEGQWYTNAILWAAEQNIVAGKGDNFDVNGKITRQEMATILYKYAANYKGYEVDGRAEFTGYADADSISNWAVENMKWALNYGIMKGKGQNLAPLENATRAECAAMLNNFINAYE